MHQNLDTCSNHRIQTRHKRLTVNPIHGILLLESSEIPGRNPLKGSPVPRIGYGTEYWLRRFLECGGTCECALQGAPDGPAENTSSTAAAAQSAATGSIAAAKGAVLSRVEAPRVPRGSRTGSSGTAGDGGQSGRRSAPQGREHKASRSGSRRESVSAGSSCGS